jgi:hypothetical protein
MRQFDYDHLNRTRYEAGYVWDDELNAVWPDMDIHNRYDPQGRLTSMSDTVGAAPPTRCTNSITPTKPWAG